MIATLTTVKYSPINELEIKLVLKFRISDNELIVNGILQGLEEINYRFNRDRYCYASD